MLALQALRANKVRALLTMLGVVIGSSCIVMVVTIGLAGRHYIIGQIESVGANLVYATVVRAGVSRPITLDDQILAADLNAIKETIPQLNEVAGTNDVPMTVVVNGKERPINLVGVTEGFQQIRNLEILRGNYFGQDDLRSRRKICLITKDLASLLFPLRNPYGRGHSHRRIAFHRDRRFQGARRNIRADRDTSENRDRAVSIDQGLYWNGIFQDALRPGDSFR